MDSAKFNWLIDELEALTEQEWFIMTENLTRVRKNVNLDPKLYYYIFTANPDPKGLVDQKLPFQLWPYVSVVFPNVRVSNLLAAFEVLQPNPVLNFIQYEELVSFIRHKYWNLRYKLDTSGLLVILYQQEPPTPEADYLLVGKNSFFVPTAHLLDYYDLLTNDMPRSLPIDDYWITHKLERFLNQKLSRCDGLANVGRLGMTIDCYNRDPNDTVRELDTFLLPEEFEIIKGKIHIKDPVKTYIRLWEDMTINPLIRAEIQGTQYPEVLESLISSYV